ncbi:L-lactate dehydrogenase [Helcococcus ovis]|uniref:L-lactate dehydrogenase n=1 Tax=Helcococcus ovis TaxID=72026 RepID=A0A4R9C0A2_9FIRM|nr:L-lactate dehydrogenase [Helcococcus ovis]TFF64453.1 L-lactate dehydrogenase [Helcococcus ovis]TFF64699.1 L-lactate dehydrogenase [Helcococcus ovis]TFF68099.1 L-lactate dehydrogenase [Helcococcus ovis]WNZ01956.1 L-lactate dehydrogenase [Helcococcus ovis]
MKKNKIILVGDGAVGSSFAFACTILGVGRELGIIDLNADKAEGDAMDLSDALAFTASKDIYKATYEDCHDADIVVITAGIPQKPGETRLQLVDKNLKIFKDIVTSVVGSGFNGIFLVASNPVDVMTYATWKYSGFNANRVIGTGTVLDSNRLRKEIAEITKVDPKSIHAYIMGEHGDSEFPVWSHANIGGLPIAEWTKHNQVDEETLLQSFDKVRDAAYEIINRKGATFYGIAVAMAKIAQAILNNENSIYSVSSYLRGEYGQEDLYIGVPAIINSNGVKNVLEISLNDNEQERMNASAKTLRDIIEKSFYKK